MIVWSDVLIRIAAAVAGLVFIRDGIAGLRGTRLLITKGYSTQIFEGWQSRLIGVFLFFAAIALLGVAWFGL